MNNGQPSLFLITACYNAEATIGDTLSSLAIQADQWEHYFVIDGVSTDNTLKHVNRFQDEYPDRMTVISEPDNGVYEAMNKGIARVFAMAADDDLVALINADDYYTPQALQVIREVAGDHPDIDMFYGDIEMIDNEGQRTGTIQYASPELTKQSVSDGMPLNHPALFIRAKVYRSLGLFDESYRIAADYEFVLRLFENGISSLYIERPLVLFREGGISTTAIEASLQEAMRARIEHGANPLTENMRYFRQKVNERVYGSLRYLSSVERRYQSRHQ